MLYLQYLNILCYRHCQCPVFLRVQPGTSTHDKTFTTRKNSKIIKVVRGWDFNLEGATLSAKANALMTELPLLYSLDVITKSI